MDSGGPEAAAAAAASQAGSRPTATSLAAGLLMPSRPSHHSSPPPPPFVLPSCQPCVQSTFGLRLNHHVYRWFTCHTRFCLNGPTAAQYVRNVREQNRGPDFAPATR
jgi:hypothetical protein